jgi:hypothetical protein
LNLFTGGGKSQDDVHVSTSASEPNKDKDFTILRHNNQHFENFEISPSAYTMPSYRNFR